MEKKNDFLPVFDPSELFAQMSAATGGFLNRANRFASDVIGKVNPDLQSVHTRQTSDSFDVEIALPGYSKDDVDVSIDSGVLVITIKAPKDNKLSFYGNADQLREFPLPRGARTEKMVAKIVNGVLKVAVPVAGTPAVRVTVA